MNAAFVERKAAVWIGGIFLLGAAFGGFLGYLFALHSVSATNAPTTEQARRAQKVEQLTLLLDLTEVQRQQLNTILAQVHDEISAIRKQSDPKVDQARQKGRDRIRAVLTPEQKPKFEDFLNHLDEKRRRNAIPGPH